MTQNADCPCHSVVGGGTAGLVLASRLSSESSCSVLVLEAGEDHTNDTKVRCPGIFASMYGNHAYDWDYVNEPQVSESHPLSSPGREHYLPRPTTLTYEPALPQQPYPRKHRR